MLDRRPFADRDGSTYEVRAGERPLCHPASVPPAWDDLGMVSDGAVFPGLSKLLNQEDALGAPCLDTVIAALRRRALAGRRNAADRHNPSLRYRITACYTGHQA